MDRLIERFSRLPGIGKRSAERVAFYLLKQSPEEAGQLANAITGMKNSIRQCSVCYNVSESDPCPICTNPKRDQRTILVVEEPKDLVSFELTGMYRGVYHVLMGRLAPLDGINAGDLTIEALLNRVKPDSATEVILGTSPTLEGDGTALYLAQELDQRGAKLTRLARGLPTGVLLETVSKAVLGDAIHGRQELKG